MTSTDDQELLKLVNNETVASSTLPPNESETLSDRAALPSSAETLDKLLAGSTNTIPGGPSNGAGKSTLILYIPGFRKIEPKPGQEARDDGEGREIQEREGKPSPVTQVTRLLGINPTKRGVKTCPRCFKLIGYRSKQCKYCSPSKKAKPPKAFRPVQIVTTKQTDQAAIEVAIEHVQQQSLGDRSRRQVEDKAENEAISTEIRSVEEAVMTEVVSSSQPDIGRSLSPGQGEQEIEPCEQLEQAGETCDMLEQEADKDAVVVVESAPPISVAEETVPSEVSPQVSEKMSLQDLICGLLAQNQASLSARSVIGNESPTETTTIAIQTDPEKQNPGSPTSEEPSPGEKTGLEGPVDANSVALFLGQMAQRNGKKRQMSPNTPSRDNPGNPVAGNIPGMQADKGVLALSGDSKACKFRKIQPKCSGAVTPEEIVTGGEMQDEVVEVKYEGQTRIMNGNATRRGVMECSECHRLIGCRSKTCKHCRTQIVDETARMRRHKMMCQAVELHLPKGLNVKLFSVRKCKTGPELRCFVRVEEEASSNKATSSWITNTFSCDYPVCIASKEIGDKYFKLICEHARACFTPSARGVAVVPRLDPLKLAGLPISERMKEEVRVLHERCTAEGVSLVQYVSCKTLAVVDQLREAVEDNTSLADSISFTHVRFDNVKGPGCFQRQVYCSGKSCMAWNFISNNPDVDGSSTDMVRACSCPHYGACLWAIASDPALAKDFGEYLDMFTTQFKASSADAGGEK